VHTPITTCLHDAPAFGHVQLPDYSQILLLTYSSDYCVFSMHFTMDTILFTLEIIEYIIVRDGLVIRNEPFIFIMVKALESACRHLQKTIPMRKIATPRPAVEWAKVHRVNLFRDAAPVRSCRADRRNIACSFGILRGTRRHRTPSEDLSDLEITWVVSVYKH